MPSIIQNFMLHYSRSSRNGQCWFFENRNLHDIVEKPVPQWVKNTNINPQNAKIKILTNPRIKKPKNKKSIIQNTDIPGSNNDTQKPKNRNNINISVQIIKKQKEALLTG